MNSQTDPKPTRRALIEALLQGKLEDLSNLKNDLRGVELLTLAPDIETFARALARELAALRAHAQPDTTTTQHERNNQP